MALIHSPSVGVVMFAPVSHRFEKRRKPGAGANPPGVSAREAYPPRGTMRPGASADKRRITSL
jgi:hypothetical protein